MIGMHEAPEAVTDGCPPAPGPLAKLSAREQEVALLLARGENNREIAAALGISIKTVDTHRGNLLKKLGLRGNVALTLFCVRNDLVTP